MYVRALAGKEKALGPDHTSTLTPSTISGCCIVTKASWLRLSRCTCGRWPGRRRR